MQNLRMSSQYRGLYFSHPKQTIISGFDSLIMLSLFVYMGEGVGCIKMKGTLNTITTGKMSSKIHSREDAIYKFR